MMQVLPPVQRRAGKPIRFMVATSIATVLAFWGNRLLAQPLPLPDNLISLDSDAGETLLFESDAREDYFPLTQYFVTQDNLAYCGVASMVMVLNALDVEAPVAPEYQPFHFFTQQNVFDSPQTRQVLSPDVVARQGMTLEELGNLLASYSIDVQVYHADTDSTDMDKFREMAV
ncbi:MAG TPA: phytochelatin synthase family protein, partial [Allocoleopsis sp.]